MKVRAELTDIELLEIIKNHFKINNIGTVTGIFKDARDENFQIVYETCISKLSRYKGDGPGGRD